MSKPNGYVSVHILDDIISERERQENKFPNQHLSSGTHKEYAPIADEAREYNDNIAKDLLTWLDVLKKEFYEAASEEDPSKLRKELIQVAATCVRWIQDIDNFGERI